MLRIGVVRESSAGERRVALVPAVIPVLTRSGIEVTVAAGAGAAAGYGDDAYREKGAKVVADPGEALSAGVVAQVQVAGQPGQDGTAELAAFAPGTVVIGLCAALTAPPVLRRMAELGLTTFALELMPRITRAQSMDVLSSQATVAGYKAVLLAAEALPKMFPMLTTAAGTVSPARVLVIGAGVAGLQAIATARRLGAVVEAYDVRPAAREQVESLGARFVELPLDTAGAEASSGYARAFDEDFYRRQGELLARVVAATDAVITTALVPGKNAPVLLTSAMVAGMAPGSVVVDLAAEQGGNCEVTRPDEVVRQGGVTVLGPTNLAATVPYHASQMYARNMGAFLAHLVRDGELHIDLDDEITRATLVTHQGEIVNARVREAFGLVALDSGGG